jgi:hypothetical protein
MKNYLIGTFILLLVMAGVVVQFNFWTDPYSIYRYESADPDRISRIDQIFYMRMSKPWQVAQAKPSAVVIGSSRTGAVRPGAESAGGKGSYNLAMPGITLYEMLRLIQHANSQGNLARLTIGLEYETFLAGGPRFGLGFQEGRLGGAQPAVSSIDRIIQLVRDLQETLLSWYAVQSSIMALSGSRNSKKRFMPDGSWHNHSHIWLGEPGYINVVKDLLRRKYDIAESLDSNLAIFAEILDYCHLNGIDTRLYLSPEHVFVTDLKRHIGLDDGFQRFHVQLIDLNLKVATATGNLPFPLWGFNHIGGVVDEPLPEGAGKLESWFRDGIHFQSALGDKIMAQIWGEEMDVGRRLDNNTVQAYLDEVDALRLKFVTRYVVDVSRYHRKIIDQGDSAAE